MWFVWSPFACMAIYCMGPTEIHTPTILLATVLARASKSFIALPSALLNYLDDGAIHVLYTIWLEVRSEEDVQGFFFHGPCDLRPRLVNLLQKKNHDMNISPCANCNAWRVALCVERVTRAGPRPCTHATARSLPRSPHARCNEDDDDAAKVRRLRRQSS